MEPDDTEGVLRIGELSRRVGVSDHVLRAWENRYGLLQPVRSAGGFRLYSNADERRVRRMQEHLASGLSAAQAARAALAEEETKEVRDPAAVPATDVPEVRADWSIVTAHSTDLEAALDRFDEPAAQSVLDRLFTELTVESVLADVVMPYLQRLGQRWADGTATVAQEHFASNLIRGRLAGLARGWGTGGGPHAILACPPDEQHDLALMVFGIALNRLGWRISYLGVNTPFEDLAGITLQEEPDLLVLAATASVRFTEVRADLEQLARKTPLVLAGAGATREVADFVGARLLPDDPVSSARTLASGG